MIEISKGNYDEVCRDPKILPKSTFVINIKLSTQSNEVLQVNYKNPLDDYQILENIGFGTFSEVFKVKDLSSDEVFAAKKMKPMTIAERRLFINEYIVTVLSDHKNIIKFYKIYDYKDNLWFIQELMKCSLTRILSNTEPLPPRIINYIIQQILKALSYMHSKYVIHRDVKSDNILLNYEGEVKLADMGFSVQLTQERDKRITIAGTPCWLAPEIIIQEKYDTKVDIWSLGILMIELLEGLPPNYRKDKIYIFRKIITGQIALANPANVHPDHLRLVNYCLKYNPEERKTAYQLLDDVAFENVATVQEFRDFLKQRINE